MKERNVTVGKICKQLGKKLLLAALTLSMVAATVDVTGLTAKADAPYSIHVYDDDAGTIPYQMVGDSKIYGTGDAGGTAEALPKNYVFLDASQQERVVSEGHAIINTVQVYEGDTIYLKFATGVLPKNACYNITSNYNDATGTWGIKYGRLAASAITAFKIPYNYTNLTVTAIDESTNHTGANPDFGGSFLYVLDINILPRTSLADVESLVSACAKDYPYTGVEYSPFDDVLAYFDVINPSVLKATNRGTYTVTLQPKADNTIAYKWADATGEAAFAPKTFTWSITKGSVGTAVAPILNADNKGIKIANPQSNQKYSLDGVDWMFAAAIDALLENLGEGEERTVYTKIPGNDNYDDSAIVSAKATTQVTVIGKVINDTGITDSPLTVTVGGKTVQVDADGNYSVVLPVGNYNAVVTSANEMVAGVSGNFTASASNKKIPDITLTATDKGIDYLADQFVNTHLKKTPGDTEVYTAVTADNRKQIYDALDAWEKLDTKVQARVNSRLQTANGGQALSYTNLFEDTYEAKIGDVTYLHLSDAFIAVTDTTNTIEMYRNPEKPIANATLPTGATITNKDTKSPYYGNTYTAKNGAAQVSVATDKELTLSQGTLTCKDTKGAPVGVKVSDTETIKVSSTESSYDVTVPENGVPYAELPNAGGEISMCNEAGEASGISFSSDKENGKLYLPNPLAAEGEESGKVTARLNTGKNIVTKAGKAVSNPDTNAGDLLVTNESVTVKKDGDAVVIADLDGGSKEYKAKQDDTVVKFGEKGPELAAGAVELDQNEVIYVSGKPVRNANDAEDAKIVVTMDGSGNIIVDVPVGGEFTLGDKTYTNDGTADITLNLNPDALDFIENYLTKDGKVYTDVDDSNFDGIISEAIDAFEELSETAQAVVNELLKTDKATGYNSFEEYVEDARVIVQEKAEKFIKDYLSDGEVADIYTVVTDDNYSTIHSGKSEWDHMAPSVKTYVNNALKDKNPANTYESMYENSFAARIGNDKYATLADAMDAVKENETIEMIWNPEEITEGSLPNGAALKNTANEIVYTAKEADTEVSVDTDRNVTLKSGTLQCDNTEGAVVFVEIPEDGTLEVSSKAESYEVTVPKDGGAAYVKFPEAGEELEVGGVRFSSDKEEGKLYLPNPLAAEDEESGKVTAKLAADTSVEVKNGRTVENPAGNAGELIVTNDDVTVENAEDKVIIDGNEYTAKSDNTRFAFDENGDFVLAEGSVELDKDEVLRVGNSQIKNTCEDEAVKLLVTVDEEGIVNIDVPAGGTFNIDGKEYANIADAPINLTLSDKVLDFIREYLSTEEDVNGNVTVYNAVNAGNYAKILSGREYFETELTDDERGTINCLLAGDEADKYNSYAEYLAQAEIVKVADEFIKANLAGKEGITYDVVNGDNYEQILASEELYGELEEDVQKAVEQLLGEDNATHYNTYAEYLARAKAAEAEINDFIKKYLTGDGKVYNAVDGGNYEQIVSGKKVFEAYDKTMQNAINRILAIDDAENYNSYAEYLKDGEAIERAVNDFIKVYLSDKKTGKVYNYVDGSNYEQILSGQAAFANLSKKEQTAVNMLLGADEAWKYNSYVEYLAAAKEAKSAVEYEIVRREAESFVEKYLTDKKGHVYTKATKDNYAQILSGEEKWNKLSELEQSKVNAKLMPKTYEELLEEAKLIQKYGRISPKTGDNSAVGLGIMLLLTGVAALFGSYVYEIKKKKAK